MKELKEKYDFKCSECGKELWFKPSLAMQFNLNSGHCSCPDCKTFLHLFINENNEGMSEEWETSKHRRDFCSRIQ